MRCRYCKGELIHHCASAYKCDSCGRVFEMFEEESFEDLKNQIKKKRGGINMIPTPNLIQGELYALGKKRIPASHSYSKKFYPPKFIKNLERHLIKRYPKLKIDVVEDEQSYVVYLYRK